MTTQLQINVEIKKDNPILHEDSQALVIDREVRLLLRDNLEAAIEDAMNDLVCCYRYETSLVKLQISNVNV